MDKFVLILVTSLQTSVLRVLCVVSWCFFWGGSGRVGKRYGEGQC